MKQLISKDNVCWTVAHCLDALLPATWLLLNWIKTPLKKLPASLPVTFRGCPGRGTLWSNRLPICKDPNMVGAFLPLPVFCMLWEQSHPVGLWLWGCAPASTAFRVVRSEHHGLDGKVLMKYIGYVQFHRCLYSFSGMDSGKGLPQLPSEPSSCFYWTSLSSLWFSQQLLSSRSLECKESTLNQ